MLFDTIGIRENTHNIKLMNSKQQVNHMQLVSSYILEEQQVFNDIHYIFRVKLEDHLGKATAMIVYGTYHKSDGSFKYNITDEHGEEYTII